METLSQDRIHFNQQKRLALAGLEQLSLSQEKKSYFLHQLSSSQSLDTLSELTQELKKLSSAPKLKLLTQLP